MKNLENTSSRFRQVFTNRHTILPVIHVADQQQALRNATLAYECGCDGVFLINHGCGYQELLAVHQAIYNAFPKWWIGVNCLDLDPIQVFQKIPATVDGVWVDSAMLDENAQRQLYPARVLEIQQQQNWQGLYFGGTAFKYQRAVTDLAHAAQLATRYMDVVTTSGPSTGKAASTEKIRIMKEAIGGFPLAIASGITPENVDAYLAYADCFLVATGISHTFEELDRAKTIQLVTNIRDYNSPFE